MEISHFVRAGAVAALMAAPCGAANAGALKIVEVAAPAINCVFSPLCTIILPTDSTAPIPLNLTTGTAFLQTRTFFGIAGTPGGGHTAYEYRVDLRSAMGEGGRASADVSRVRARSMLVVDEVALCMTLLAGSALLI